MKRFFILIILTGCSTLPENKEKLVIYLHGMGKNPLNHEKANIKAMANTANNYGYKFTALEAKGNCSYLKPPKLDFKCWDHKKVKSQLATILKGHEDKELVLIGFSNGGYFLGGAFERNLLGRVSKVGIISGASIWMNKFPELKKSPKIYIENGARDQWNKKWVQEFHNRLVKNLAPRRLFYRVVERGHLLSVQESKSFLSWVLKN